MSTFEIEVRAMCLKGKDTACHAVPRNVHRALCGRIPGVRSGPWQAGAEVTCARCLKVMRTIGAVLYQGR